MDKTKNETRKFSSAMRIVFAILDFYAFGLILFLLLMLIPRRPLIVEMLCNFLSWALLPSLFFLIALLVMRRWRNAILWIVPAIAFFVLFGELFVPGIRPNRTDDITESSSSRHLRVMTWNLKGNMPNDPSPQIEFLRDSGADIIALQEVTSYSAPLIESQLTELYPYQILFPRGVAGTGILSKFPIENQKIFQLVPGSLYNCRVVLNVDGELITVVSAHPSPPLSLSQFKYYSLRRTEIEAIAQMASQSGPILILGDFNITDQSSLYPLLTKTELHDTFREVGWGFGPTYPARINNIWNFCPLLRLDFIWHTDDFQALSVMTGRRMVSDHVAVFADLAYTP